MKKSGFVSKIGVWVFIAIAAGIVLLVMSSPAGGGSGTSPAAAAEDWLVESFNAGYVIRPDGVVEVTEDIVADFGNLKSHGIFRNITVQYKIDGDPKHNRLLTI